MWTVEMRGRQYKIEEKGKEKPGPNLETRLVTKY